MFINLSSNFGKKKQAKNSHNRMKKELLRTKKLR